MTVLDAIATAEQLTQYRRAERRHLASAQRHLEHNRPLMAKIERKAAQRVKRAIQGERGK